MKNKIIIPKRITKDLSYLIGVLSGDGSINVRPDKHDYEIKCVGNPKDEKEYYKKIISPLFKKVFKIRLKPKYHDGKTT